MPYFAALHGGRWSPIRRSNVRALAADVRARPNITLRLPFPWSRAARLNETQRALFDDYKTTAFADPPSQG
jgi:hypothetical protein